MNRLIACAASCLALAGGAAFGADAAPAAPQKAAAKADPKADPKAKKPELKHQLTPPAYLPELAREYLHRRMDRHGRDMQELMFSVVLLSREVARDTASRIATEPRLAKPDQSDEDTLNRALPPRFFVLQDELRDRAQKVAEAADKGTDQQLGQAYARLTETCISCHSVYLNP